MQLRAPTADDAAAVFAVMEARDVADLGAPDCTLGDVHDEWAETEFDLASDARVVEDGGRIVGYGVVRNPGAFAAVDPDAEGRGAGARLLQWLESRERERGNPRHRQYIAASNARGRALLAAAGYALARSHYRMVRALAEAEVGVEARAKAGAGPEAAPAAAIPSGVALRPVDVEADGETLYALDAASFAGASDYVPVSLTTFREEHLQTHDFDAQLSCVAQRGDQIVGFLLTRRWAQESVGYISILAVTPDEQGRGLGTAMLRHAFACYAGAGLAQAQLGVSSDNPGALRLYERIGMKPRFQFDTYERPVADSA
jgi:mycothiol synthase